MSSLVLLLVLSCISTNISAVFRGSSELGNFAESKIRILYEILSKECPNYQRENLADILSGQELGVHLRRLTQKLLDCRKPPTTAISTTTHNLQSCPFLDGDAVLNVLFLSYNNRNGTVSCQTGGSSCLIFFVICISPTNSSRCEFYHQLTEITKHQPRITFFEKIGNLPNPLEVNVGNRKWQGVNFHVTAIERNCDNSVRSYQEFSYELTDLQGSPRRLVTLRGKHSTGKTELAVLFQVPCPSPSTTFSGTPSTITRSTTTLPTATTLPTTTTSIPPECFTATNLTQSWRLDHNGMNIKGGGPHSYTDGHACDLHGMLGWFRFTGAAGTHMLDTCPKELSCGTRYPYWTDDTPPQEVGVAAQIFAYALTGHRCKGSKRPMFVLRCSLNTAHDLIYKHIGHKVEGTEACNEAFCGMN